MPLLTFALLQDNWKRMVIMRTVLVLKADAVGGGVRETFHLFGDGGHESGGRGLGNCTARGSGGGRLERCAKGDVHSGNGNESTRTVTRLMIFQWAPVRRYADLRINWHAEQDQAQSAQSSSSRRDRAVGAREVLIASPLLFFIFTFSPRFPLCFDSEDLWADLCVPP